MLIPKHKYTFYTLKRKMRLTREIIYRKENASIVSLTVIPDDISLSLRGHLRLVDQRRRRVRMRLHERTQRRSACAHGRHLRFYRRQLRLTNRRRGTVRRYVAVTTARRVSRIRMKSTNV